MLLVPRPHLVQKNVNHAKTISKGFVRLQLDAVKIWRLHCKTNASLVYAAVKLAKVGSINISVFSSSEKREGKKPYGCVNTSFMVQRSNDKEVMNFYFFYKAWVKLYDGLCKSDIERAQQS